MLSTNQSNLSFSSRLTCYFCCLFFVLFSPISFSDTYKIDPAHSSIRFSIKHLGFSYTPGRFDDINGYFSFNESRELQSAKGSIFVKTKSINTNHEKRDDFLRSYSFFNVSKHPIAMFKIKQVTRSKNNSKTGSITGTLTLLGQTHEETFALTFIGEGKDPWLGYRMGFTATGSIQRSNYNLSFMEGAIDDDVLIDIFIGGIKQ